MMAPTPTRHDRFYFEDGNVIFLVEDVLFKIHRYFLHRESPVFQDMFSFNSEMDEGKSDDKPILLEGTKSLEFACLLACFYPRSIAKHDDMPAEHWTLALDLAMKWQFNDVRELAVAQMKHVNTYAPTLALQVATARKHKMNDWYLDAFVKLCERGRPITPEEGELLGLVETVRLSAIRHKLHKGSGRRVHSIYNTVSDISISLDHVNCIAMELGIAIVPPPEQQPRLAFPPSMSPRPRSLSPEVAWPVASSPPFSRPGSPMILPGSIYD
ncbi:hypothetical protein DAEQUDRAFT_705618 [Daedalea quercina L-15889]|uniref:BTB domain-containing protein n=1 Tax=Daedalea quercina L-15889 TaxID=1314783 RepID=A0A165ST48_9APHY|nr:hypothetical protein DAEQUDRAFT_705618 [Daedalea quercina L-15889]